MDRPFVLHLARSFIRHGASRMLDRMRELKDHAQHKTCNHREDDKADHPVVPAQPVDRQRDEDKDMEKLETPEHEVIRKAHLLQRHRADMTFEILLIIQDKDPKDIKDTIQYPEIQMLITMHAVLLLRLAHPHPGLDIDIVIYPVHIRISMMHHIMLHIPHKAVPAEDIQRKSRQTIDPLIFRKTAMRPVMHHIKPYGRHQPAQNHTFHYRLKCIGGEKDQVYVNKQKAHHQ